LTDLRATIRSVLKVVYFLHTKKKNLTHGLGIFLRPNKQPVPEQGIKIFLRHFPTTLVPSLTLQIRCQPNPILQKANPERTQNKPAGFARADPERTQSEPGSNPEQTHSETGADTKQTHSGPSN
jgi:hypothetical protein